MINIAKRPTDYLEELELQDEKILVEIPVQLWFGVKHEIST